MKKFAANYLISDDGRFLKNGIAVASDDGNMIEFIDTEGDLKEIAQLTFLNGILMTDFSFIRNQSDIRSFQSDSSPESFIQKRIADQNEISASSLIDIGIHLQEQFPEMILPQILQVISNSLLFEGNFSRFQLPGLVLLSGVNLPELRFTAKSKLKKIL